MAAGAGVLGLASSDPIYAATTGYDLKNGFVAGSYQAPTGIVGGSPAKDTTLAWIKDNADTVTKLSDDIWQFAELSLREWKSSVAIANFLQRNGFKVEWGTAGLPAAFIATFQQGTGRPVLGFNGEYDALPGFLKARARPPTIHLFTITTHMAPPTAQDMETHTIPSAQRRRAPRLRSRRLSGRIA